MPGQKEDSEPDDLDMQDIKCTNCYKMIPFLDVNDHSLECFPQRKKVEKKNQELKPIPEEASKSEISSNRVRRVITKEDSLYKMAEIN